MDGTITARVLNSDRSTLERANLREGKDYTVTSHDNGYGKQFVEYHCTVCTYSNHYAQRLSEHVLSGVHLHRRRDDIPGQTPTEENN